MFSVEAKDAGRGEQENFLIAFPMIASVEPKSQSLLNLPVALEYARMRLGTRQLSLDYVWTLMRKSMMGKHMH